MPLGCHCPSAPSVASTKKYVCVYIYIDVHSHLQTANHAFTPLPPIHSSTRVHSSPFRLPHVCTSLAQKPGSHRPHYINLFAQLPYVANLLIPEGPVKAFPMPSPIPPDSLLHIGTSSLWLVATLLPSDSTYLPRIETATPFHLLPLGNPPLSLL